MYDDNDVILLRPLWLLGHVRLPINLSYASFVLLIWFLTDKMLKYAKVILAFKYNS